jgi:copper transport protein
VPFARPSRSGAPGSRPVGTVGVARVATAARWVAAALLLFVVAGPLAGTAGAHAVLIESRPGNDELVEQAPAEVVLVFDDTVVAEQGGVRVIDPDGARVEAGAPASADRGRRISQPLGDGPTGTYTVSYRVLSSDGHVISGSFVYHVERRTGAADVTDSEPPASVAVAGFLGRWLGFAGLLLAGGIVAVVLLVDRRPGVSVGGTLAPHRRPVLLAASALSVGTVLALVAGAADLAGVTLWSALGELGTTVTSSRPGTVAGLRVVAALAVLVIAAVPPLWARALVVAAGAIAVSLLLPALGGHASTASPAALAITADAGHLVSAAVWIGGLAALLLTWTGSRDRVVAFSRTALVAVTALVATGALLGWMQTRSVDALVDTDYGRLVLAKAAGAAVLVAFGFVHRRWLADTAKSVGGMVSTMRVQVVIGVAVLAVTAVLVDTPPGAGTVSQPVERIAQAGDTTVRLRVTPARSGPNEVHLFYLSPDGNLTAVDAAELRVSTQGVEPRRVPLTVVTASHNLAGGVQLTPGTWRFELTVVSRGVPGTTTFEVPIR